MENQISPVQSNSVSSVTPTNTLGTNLPQKPNPVAVAAVNQTQLSQQKLNQNFWRAGIIFLILLPILTGLGIFVFQKYTDYRISSQANVVAPKVTIDPKQVVTPEPLPFGSEADQLIPGWKRQAITSAGYTFQYPENWIIDTTDPTSIEIQNVDPQAPTERTQAVGKITFVLIPTEISEKSADALKVFTETHDSKQGLRILVASESAFRTNTGIEVYRRSITRGSEPTQYPQAFIGLDSNVLQVTGEGEIELVTEIFDQLVKTISVTAKSVDSGIESWRSFESTHGYSLRYPDDLVVLRSNDKTEPGLGDATQALSVNLFSAREIQAGEGLDNLLNLQLSDTEPSQAATQSGTRDFGNQEFKSYESKGQLRYVGQLPSGNWLQITLQFDSRIEERTQLSQIIDTIKLKERTELP